MGKATILMSSGLEKPLNHRPTMKEAQDIVGGHIELHHVKGTRYTLVLNEDGIMLHLRINSKASYYFTAPVAPHIFYGDIIVLEGWKTVG